MGSSAPSVLSGMSVAGGSNGKAPFVPKAVVSFEETGLSHAMIESLVLKFLVNAGTATGRRIATELGLPFGPFPDFLRNLKNQQIVAYTNSATVNDYVYSLTDSGRMRAKLYSEECAYVGTAPVPFDDYLESVTAQTITTEHPQEADLRRAFSDLLVSDEIFAMLGPAINSGRGMFLYGYPGNGKTSIAERITRCFGTSIWIPRVLFVEGQIIKLFDMANHEPVERENSGGLLDDLTHDRRWVHDPPADDRRRRRAEDGRPRDPLRPGDQGERGAAAAEEQLGTFVIDDFGRQRMQPVELLNRWIVPLEKRYDFLNLANGKKIHVPFDQLILFSTNLEPKDLVDEAFLRRIPYKIEATDPTEPMFRKMIEIFAPKLGFREVDPAAVDYLIQHHYQRCSRPFRCCQPRDLLLQVRNYCVYNALPLELKPEYFDFAAQNYFTVM